MQRRSLVATVALVVSLVAGQAEAVTVRDVIELSKAGLSDSVLLTLIDVDRSVFSIDTDALKQLKSAGVSDAVIVAMIRSGRERPVDNTPPPPLVQEPVQEPVSSSVAEAQPEADTSAEPAPAQAVPYPIAIPVPVYITVPVAPAHQRSPAHRAEQADVAPNCRPAQVPNWGFGGTIRQLPPLCR